MRWSDPEAVRSVATRALTSRGVARADDIVDVLMEASMSGVHTHGIRLMAAYLDELDRGVAAADAVPTAVRDSGPVVLLDAGDALGVVAGLAGAETAIDRARTFGVGLVGVRRSNHFGAAGGYTRRIAAAGLLGFATTSAASRVAPFGGIDPLFGTNPVSVAYGDEFVLDMATSQVCFGEIKERARLGDDLDDGWAVDSAGRSVTDPRQAAALAPLGGYKGHGLAMMVTILTSVLVGGPLDSGLPHIGASADGVGRGVTHLLMAVDPEALGGKASADMAIAQLIEQVRSARRSDTDTPVLIPGDPQREHARRQCETGLELDNATHALFDGLAGS